MFKKANDAKLYKEVVRQVRHLISEKILNVGDVLPSEEEMAKNIGVSRATVREGLRVLELVGMVETRRGKGTVITAINPQVIQERLSIAVDQESRELIYCLMQVRQITEPEVAKLAAEKASTEDIENIEDALCKMRKDIEEGGTGEQGSLDFHCSITKSIKNPVMTYIMTTVIDLQKESRSITLQVPGRPNLALDEHYRILEAIKERDGEKAASLMKIHLNNAMENLMKFYVREKTEKTVPGT